MTLRRVPSFSARPGFPSGLRVLLIEGGANARKEAEKLLKKCSYQVCCTDSALRTVRFNQVATREADLTVTISPPTKDVTLVLLLSVQVNSCSNCAEAVLVLNDVDAAMDVVLAHAAMVLPKSDDSIKVTAGSGCFHCLWSRVHTIQIPALGQLLLSIHRQLACATDSDPFVGGIYSRDCSIFG